MKLSAKQQKTLKLLHIITSCAWLGGACSLFMLYFAKQSIDSAQVLVGINTASRWIDIVIVISLGAVGCFLTGLIYSLCTPWGFFRHRWIAVKWVLVIAMILFGTFFLGPWEEEMLYLSKTLGQDVFTSINYAQIEFYHISWSSIQITTLIITLFISVFKPWKKKQ